MNSLSSSTPLDKAQIARQFGRAAKSYDSAAGLQSKIIDTLLDEVARNTKSERTSPTKIIDLGCGTGLGLKRLREQFPQSLCTGIDIAQTMLDQAMVASPDSVFIHADIESTPLESDQFSLALSTSTLQWCDLHQALAESYRILQPGGKLALATFGPDTHSEWRRAWSEVDDTAHTLDFPSRAKIAETIKLTGFTSTACWSASETHTFESAYAALQSVKNMGATNASQSRQRGLMGKTRFLEFMNAFERISPDYRLTYEVIYVIAEKPAHQKDEPSNQEKI